MIPDNLPTWKCPLCNQVRMKYGTTCLLFFTGECEHMNELTVNGEYYKRLYDTIVQEEESKSIGIAAISDE